MSDYPDVSAAAERHDFIAVLDFVRGGVHPDTPVAGHGSLLIYATTQGQKELAGRLITLGAKINLGDAAGNTALHHAAYLGMPDMVEYLLQRGAVARLLNGAGEDAAARAKQGAQALQLQFNGDDTMSVDDLQNSFQRFGRVALIIEEAQSTQLIHKGIPDDIAALPRFKIKKPEM
jgi:ankyrin repeat protein